MVWRHAGLLEVRDRWGHCLQMGDGLDLWRMSLDVYGGACGFDAPSVSCAESQRLPYQGGPSLVSGCSSQPSHWMPAWDGGGLC